MNVSGTYGLAPNAFPVGESRQGALIALQFLFVSLALIICALRVYSRTLTVHSLDLDDYVMILATILSLAMTIDLSIGAEFGWGKHITEVSNYDYEQDLLTGWIAEILFTMTSTTIRLSICIFYLRLAIATPFRIVIYCTISWLLLWGIAFVFVTIFECNPVDAYWHPTFNGTQNPRCINPTIPFAIHGVTSIVNDLFVYFLPMPVLWKIRLPRRQRIGLIILFGTGAIACFAGVLRLYYSVVVSQSLDVTWRGFDFWTWEAVEVNLGIACACVPALKPLVIRYFPRWLESMFGRTTGHSHPGSSAPQGTLIAMQSPTIQVPSGRDEFDSKQLRDHENYVDEEQAEGLGGGYRGAENDTSSEEYLNRRSMAAIRLYRS